MALQLTEVDAGGDLILRVGTDFSVETAGRDFKVCSAALRRASHVCKAMLFGPWKEARPEAGE